MAYLSQNHCLETLEFTMDASRYKDHYRTMSGEPASPVYPSSEGCEYVRMLWQKLIDAYIIPNGPREVNLPAEVRDELLNLPNNITPPSPSVLDAAVRIVFELMDESVLVPFLNSFSATRAPHTSSSPWTSAESMAPAEAHQQHGSLAQRSTSISPTRHRRRRDQSPSQSGVAEISTTAQSTTFSRLSRHSHLSAGGGRASGSTTARLSHYFSSSSTTSSSNDQMDFLAGLTDDCADSPSPSNSALEPMTPPTTPPTSDIGGNGSVGPSPSTSPKSLREGSGWKKMGVKLGWMKKGSHASSGSTSGSRNPPSREGSGSTPREDESSR